MFKVKNQFESLYLTFARETKAQYRRRTCNSVPLSVPCADARQGPGKGAHTSMTSWGSWSLLERPERMSEKI